MSVCVVVCVCVCVWLQACVWADGVFVWALGNGIWEMGNGLREYQRKQTRAEHVRTADMREGRVEDKRQQREGQCEKVK